MHRKILRYINMVISQHHGIYKVYYTLLSDGILYNVADRVYYGVYYYYY